MATEKKTDDMFATEFTPDPWSIGRAADNSRAVFGSDGSVAIAEIIGFPLRKEEQAKANELLITAAPALYHAAIVALGIISRGEDPHDAEIYLQQALQLAGWKG